MEFLSTVQQVFSGVGSTLLIFFSTLVFSLPLGLLVAMGRMNKWSPFRAISPEGALGRFKPIQLIIKFFISILRGTPLMLQLIVWFYGPYYIFGWRLSTCPNRCEFHSILIQNLLALCARKNLQLSRRMQHTAQKTIRGRLVSYFSQCAKQAGSLQFDVPYNRQQLADYLNVDRSALSAELGRMQRDGLITFQRSHFELLSALSI